MKTTPQPGTLLKLRTPSLIAYNAPPDDRIHAGEAVMLVSVLYSELIVLHASGAVATIPCGDGEYAIYMWFEVLS